MYSIQSIQLYMLYACITIYYIYIYYTIMYMQYLHVLYVYNMYVYKAIVTSPRQKLIIKL